MKLHASLLLTAILLALTACGHTPAPRYYVLSGPPLASDAALREGPRVGLGPITLPSYLDRPQIVTRASATELTLAQAHRWAEPLNVSFARALQAELLHRLPTSDVVLHPWSSTSGVARQVSVDVLRFERDVDGRFVLGARWAVQVPGSEPQSAPHTSEIALPAGQDDYAALVAAANGAIATLAEQITAALGAMP